MLHPRFEAFALLLMREMPVSRAAELMRETDTRLWRMLFRLKSIAYAEADFSQVCCVGVDGDVAVREGRNASVLLRRLGVQTGLVRDRGQGPEPG